MKPFLVDQRLISPALWAIFAFGMLLSVPFSLDREDHLEAFIAAAIAVLASVEVMRRLREDRVSLPRVMGILGIALMLAVLMKLLIYGRLIP